MANNRTELIYLLTQAAILEHSLCCQYLFAAFSLKRDPAEGLTPEQLNHVNDWGQMLFMIARQEMEHLGIVCNLLTAIGASPVFDRPNFPQGPRFFPIASSLQKLDEEALRRFICFERPANVAPPDDPCLMLIRPPSGEINPHLHDWVDPYPVHAGSVGELYQAIVEEFQELPPGDARFFVGPPKAQIGGADFGLNFARVGSLGGVYDVTLFPVTDRDSALRAIDLIIRQGEGLNDPNDPFTHYQRFVKMLADFQALKKQDPQFEPARNVAPNPYLYQYDTTDQPSRGGNRITDPLAREVLDLFNAVYETMLMLLMRFYAHTDESADEMRALTYTLFPLMTMVIRPLSEVLTRMPADTLPGRYAGPSFELSAPVQFLPHKRSAWAVLTERLNQMAARCTELTTRPGMPQRLTYIAESMDLIANRFTVMLAHTPGLPIVPGQEYGG